MYCVFLINLIFIGTMTILYADDNHIVFYECYKELSDGSCSPEDTYVEIMAKTLDSVDEDFKTKVFNLLDKACISKEDIILTRQESKY